MSIPLLAVALLVAASPEPLHPRAITSSLPALRVSGSALANESARVAAWLDRLDPELGAVSLEPGCEALVLALHGARPLPLSPELARGLVALSRYQQAFERSAREPVTAAVARRGFEAEATGAELRAAFARAYAGPRVFDRALGHETVFEPGGIAWLEEGSGDRAPRIRLQPVDDPVHAFARDVLALRAKPVELASLLRANPLRSRVLDSHGLLAAVLERHPPAEPYPERAQRGLDLVLNTLGANVADSYGLDEATLARALIADPPRGRYLGLWHGHPGEHGGDPPSEEDKRVARIAGRFITLIERDDGVDIYDLRREDTEPEPLRRRW